MLSKRLFLITHSNSLSLSVSSFKLSSYKCTNKWSNFDLECCSLTCIYSKFSLETCLKAQKDFLFGGFTNGKINNIQCELRTKYNLKHVSNEQKKCWLKFVELRGQISYRVEARGFFYLQLLFTNASLIPLFAWLFPPPLLPFIHIKFYLFIRLNWQLCKWPLPFTIRLW